MTTWCHYLRLFKRANCSDLFVKDSRIIITVNWLVNCVSILIRDGYFISCHYIGADAAV